MRTGRRSSCLGLALSAAAGAAAVAAALFPAAGWRWAAWGWYLATAYTGLQAPCGADNPWLMALWERAEANHIAGLPAVPAPRKQMAELAGAAYSWDALEAASQHWTVPVIVRGLYAASPARELWADPQYWVDAFPGHPVQARRPLAGMVDWADLCRTAGAQHYAVDDLVAAAAPGSGGFMTTLVLFAGANASVVEEALPVTALGEDLPLAIPVPGMMFSYADEPRLTTDWHANVIATLAAELTSEKEWEVYLADEAHLVRPCDFQNGFLARGFPDAAVLAQVPPMLVRTRPGDVLYLPPWTWHRVTHARGGEVATLATMRLAQFAAAARQNPWLTVGALRALGQQLVGRLFPGLLVDTIANAHMVHEKSEEAPARRAAEARQRS